MTTARGTWREIAAYLATAYALALAVAIALPHARINLLISLAIPVVAVVLLTFTITRPGRRRALWRGFGLGTAGLRTWPSAIALPVALCLSAYGVALLLGAGRLSDGVGAPRSSWAIGLVVSLVLGTVLILGEEIGWRGYLLPRLRQVTTPRKAAVATGLAHGCFHLPLILIASTYDTGGSKWLAAPAAVGVITAGGVFYAWLWERTRSVWPVAVAHNVVNTVFDLGAAAVVATAGWNLAYIAGETGLATLAVCAILAAILLMRSSVWQHVHDPRAEARPASAWDTVA